MRERILKQGFDIVGSSPAMVRLMETVAQVAVSEATVMVTGMLSTKDVAGYLRPLAAKAESLTAVAIPGESATLSAEETAEAARIFLIARFQ